MINDPPVKEFKNAILIFPSLKITYFETCFSVLLLYSGLAVKSTDKLNLQLKWGCSVPKSWSIMTTDIVYDLGTR